MQYPGKFFSRPNVGYPVVLQAGLTRDNGGIADANGAQARQCSFSSITLVRASRSSVLGDIEYSLMFPSKL